MNFTILAIVLVFIVVLSIAIRRSDKKDKEAEKKFWEREHDANFARKKNIDSLEYVVIPDDILSIINNIDSEISSSDELNDAIAIVNDLKNKKIYNLNGISNTDVKLTYGASNITLLSEYDENYSMLIKSLDYIAGAILGYPSENEVKENIDKSRRENAKTILEFATANQSDIARTYRMLSEIYISDGEAIKLHILSKNAEKISTFRGDSIRKLIKSKMDEAL